MCALFSSSTFPVTGIPVVAGLSHCIHMKTVELFSFQRSSEMPLVLSSQHSALGGPGGVSERLSRPSVARARAARVRARVYLFQVTS